MQNEEDLQIVCKSGSIRVLARSQFHSISRQDDGNFLVRFSQPTGSVEITLPFSAAYLLAEQIGAHISQAGEENRLDDLLTGSLRRSCKMIGRMSDRAIQLMVRESASETVIDFLWIMADEQVINRILDNLSSRAAEMLLEDVREKWQGKKPALASRAELELGRAAMQEMFQIAAQMLGTGELIALLGESA